MFKKYITKYFNRKNYLNLKSEEKIKQSIISFKKYHEEKILNIINMKVKKKIMLSCYNEFISKQYLYCFQYHPNLKNLTLKISGVWENETHIGLVFKLYYNMSTEKLSNIIC